MKIVAMGLILAVGTAASTVASAKFSLGVYDGWGAFRDESEGRCYAIAEPPSKSAGKPYASVGFWPRHRVRAQVYFRLSREKQPGAAITLIVGSQRFPLRSGGRNAWAADARVDAAIVAAMRSAPMMSLQGAGIGDRYRLRGAASAIDAAALACARMR